MDIVILDNGLIGKGEHSFKLIRDVSAELDRRHVHRRIFGCRTLDPAIVSELGAQPHFSHSLYDTLDPTPFERRLRRLRYRLRRPPPEPYIPSERRLHGALNLAFEQDLAALPDDVWAPDNLVVVVAISHNQLLGLVRFLRARRRSADLPPVVCQLMFAPTWSQFGRLASKGERFYRKAFALARPLLERSLFFTTENTSMAALFEKRFGIRTEILPVPFGGAMPAGPTSQPPRLGHDDFGSNRPEVMNVTNSEGSARDAGGKPVSTFPRPALGAFGYSRAEKGFHLLPGAIERCRRAGIEAEFVVQVQHGEWEQVTIAADRALRAMPDVRILDGVLSAEDYQSWTDRMDVVLLPYDPMLFGLRGSGLFTESVAAGRPIVASAGTYAGESIARGEAEGEVFSPYDSEALAAAIVRLLPRLADCKAAAAKRARAFAREHSAAAYVDILLSHADCNPTGPDQTSCEPSSP